MDSERVDTIGHFKPAGETGSADLVRNPGQMALVSLRCVRFAQFPATPASREMRPRSGCRPGEPASEKDLDTSPDATAVLCLPILCA